MTYSNIAIKCSKLTNRALVLVLCHFVKVILKQLFTKWALVPVLCHFVTYSNIAIKCLKLTNRALVLVLCHLVKGIFETTFHESGSRPSPVPLRDIQQHGYKMLKTHEVNSRTSLVPLLRCSWAASGVLLGCSWAVLGCPGPDFLLIP